MATLQQQRQAIAAGMAASRAPTGQAERQAIGAAMEGSRRAGGQAMIERRTGRAVADDINSLAESRPQRKTLRPIAPVGALPPTRGRGVYKAPPAATGGAGISWPLVEGAGAGDEPEFARTFHDASTTLVTTDGLLRLEVLQVKAIVMHDANGEVGELRFAKRPPKEGEP
ncbi:hypothetical protein [Stutzerimonas nitrititolerans]|uniref:hypothetical protein n=1 Tax=Stutzerimonas nitrititolerans TaxID=2482751 RepID=UPI0028A896EB|nr:hypothetical protein [Stutzerimonas nitrititolerans]